ncbi:MAG TPA: uroporphyrinogen-III C-methyltransferase [Gemmataceae bacterium]|nr:uroporphyrinogen-III C-methyltransferase [Gemmataceae bacterium]
MSAGRPRDNSDTSSIDEFVPRVFLVGAGPGNPGLLTLRAVECLAQAEVVIYDRLLPDRLLHFVPAAAVRIPVASLPGRHAERCPHITEALLDAARRGKRVVRLKGGDPFLFGRGAEEAQALREAGIPYEIVPGVTAALGAGAFAGIPLTHRLHASAVALVTGHECAKPEVATDWSALAHFPGTLAIYMGMANLPLITQNLVAHGKSPDTPAAAIRWGSTGEQRTVEAPLHRLADAVRTAGLEPPALVVIGSVVSMRSQLAWWEERPLFGKRVLVTRPGPQAEDLVTRLERLGAVAFSLPTVAIGEPTDWSPVDRALANLPRYNWLVFTSANGVHALIKRIGHLGRDLRSLGSLQIAAIGPGTADALHAYHLTPDLVPAKFDSETLAAALRERAAGKRVLLARADRGRELLREELAEVADVDQVAAYSQTDVQASDSPVVARLEAGEMDFITATSSNIVRSLYANLGNGARERVRRGEIEIVSISPVTSDAVRELGWPVATEAKEATTAGVVRALVARVRDWQWKAKAETANVGSAQVAKRVDGKEQHQPTGQDAKNIDYFADAAEGHVEKQVEEEQ